MARVGLKREEGLGVFSFLASSRAVMLATRRLVSRCSGSMTLFWTAVKRRVRVLVGFLKMLLEKKAFSLVEMMLFSLHHSRTKLKAMLAGIVSVSPSMGGRVSGVSRERREPC